MLDLDMEEWVRPKNESLEDLNKHMKLFMSKWDKFDWTQDLE